MPRDYRVSLIVLLSFMTTFLTVTNAFMAKKQFYPAVVYLTKSSGTVAVLYFQAAVLAYLLFSFVRWIFFGQLRVAEVENATDRLWHAIVETCLAFTVFRDDFSPKFVAQFFILFFFKGFHWLTEDRVDYMERSPTITLLFHARIMGILSLLAAVDSYSISNAYFVTLQRGASVQIVFGFEYAVLLTSIIHIAMKYILHINDIRSAHPWEAKAVYMLYTELIITFFRCVLYFFFALIMVRIHTFPLFAIRPFYMTVRAFQKSINDVIQSRRAIHAMNNLYPLATEQELRDGDNTCIICREEMTVESGAKKLPCSHIFHPNCLRSWFQRQQTCPTCRTDVLGATRDRFQQNGNQLGDGVAAFLAGIGLPQFQQNRNQAAAARPEDRGINIGGAGVPGGVRVEIGFGNGQNRFILPPHFLQQAAARLDAQPADGQQNATNGTLPTGASPFVFPTPVQFPQPPTYSGLTDIELATMEGQQRAAIEARLQALRNIQTLLDAANLQFQQYLSIAPSVNLPQATSSTTGPSNSTSTVPQPSSSSNSQQPQAAAQ
ncbi:RING-type E3 ubiquitin transferase [Aphelenchoides besseyi]|nr:RING-type E3 ubiquitin transferase [Aphelenchoides besseyi]